MTAARGSRLLIPQLRGLWCSLRGGMADKVVKLERREYVETETEHRRQYEVESRHRQYGEYEMEHRRQYGEYEIKTEIVTNIVKRESVLERREMGHLEAVLDNLYVVNNLGRSAAAGR